MNHVVLLAAGRSERFGKNKLLEKIGEKTILEISISKLQSCGIVDEIVLVVSKEIEEYAKYLSEKFPKVSKIVLGGRTRRESSKIGVESVNGNPEDKILIHDAARPLASCDLFERVIEKLSECECAIPVVDVRDTIAVVESGRVLEIPRREKLKAVQTPQGFRFELARKIAKIDADVTDDSSLALIAGYRVCTVEGERTNLKITHPEDIEIARSILPLLENLEDR